MIPIPNRQSRRPPRFDAGSRGFSSGRGKAWRKCHHRRGDGDEKITALGRLAVQALLGWQIFDIRVNGRVEAEPRPFLHFDLYLGLVDGRLFNVCIFRRFPA